MRIPRIKASDIPFVTPELMREVDRLLVEEFGLQLLQVMENAGRALAELTRKTLKNDVREKKIAVLVGAGNNGGGGMVAARHLHDWGARVTVIAGFIKDRLKQVPLEQWKLLERAGMDLLIFSESTRTTARSRIRKSTIVLDALIGYGLRNNPSGFIAELIRITNESRKRVISLDLPSGLDGTTGEIGEPSINAVKTLTLALPKQGLRSEAARKKTGQLYVAEIGVPPVLFGRLKIGLPPIFSRSSIVELRF